MGRDLFQNWSRKRSNSAEITLSRHSCTIVPLFVASLASASCFGYGPCVSIGRIGSRGRFL
ncbi:Unknown protein sequence [Pseudomonas syringae pv. ribicola]|uniref:Uncharacterized protein n=1 Tax=Pseudomonas syringae pv. ribicola TaxID=55398 RepID=A0A0Q0B706_PSESI|nr:Unknown protein sequence [Pseudomonas syringae pv. ribicola]